MGKVDYNTEWMRELARSLMQLFPTDSGLRISESRFAAAAPMPVAKVKSLKRALNKVEPDESDKNHELFDYQSMDLTDHCELRLPPDLEPQQISVTRYGQELRQYLERFRDKNASVFIDDFCAEVNIQRTHLYKILRGERRPSRDLAIAFCFPLKICKNECQDLILHLGEQLHERVKRDYIILFGLDHRLDLDSINEILEHYHELPLIRLDS